MDKYTKLIRLLFRVNNNIIECRAEISKMKRLLNGEDEYIELSEDVADIIIPEKIYDKLCELIDSDDLRFMGIT